MKGLPRESREGEDDSLVKALGRKEPFAWRWGAWFQGAEAGKVNRKQVAQTDKL